ncbi:cupin domain-containing protein [Burkholderia sp. ABCPW 14]|uniref:cupin domain-containing protein n=1 Tax=Burkholderia sp. ABCPW 14 TaxID=1637860 RepID=UPI0009ECAC9F
MVNIVDWRSELERSRYDSIAGIRIAKLAGDARFSTYLTMIDPGKAVSAHYHKNGDEHYHVIRGHGEMTLTDVVSHRTKTTAVSAENSFVVPENTVHVLKNTGTEPLVLMFSCPENHLGQDRFVL